MSVKASIDITESIQRDVVFLLDCSDDMQNEFEAMLDFVERIVEKLSVEPNKDRVSVVQYSRDPSADFFLNTYKTQQNVIGAIQGLRHKGGRPLNTGAALQYVKDKVFTVSSGSRHQEGVPQILILLTGGQSSDDIRNAGANLNGFGVMVFVVGMKNADTRELQTISHEASYAYFAADVNDLSAIDKQIFSAIKKAERSAITPALHGKTIMVAFYCTFVDKNSALISTCLYGCLCYYRYQQKRHCIFA